MNGRRAIQSASDRRTITPLPLVLLAALLFLTGCATEPEVLTVAVRDLQTQQPISDAWVQLRPLHLFSSEPPYAIVDPSPAAGGSGTTGPDGTTQIPGVVDHPMDVRILAPGYVPLYLTIVVDPRITKQPWNGPPVDEDTEDVLPALAVQIRP